MKKFLFMLLFVFPLIFAGCGEDSTNDTSGSIIIPVTETATFQQDTLYSILKTTKNTTALAAVTGASNVAGDTVTVTFPNASAEDFTLSQGFYFDDAYGIALYRNSKTTTIDKFNISVKNRLGTEILNRDGYMFTVHKIYPYYIDSTIGNLPIPYPDNNVFKFNAANPSQTILFQQVVTEYNNSYEDGNMTNISGDTPVYITSYGFDSQNLNNTTTYNNFTVDAVSTELEYNGTMYPNCLNYKGTSACAVKITNDNTALESSAVFYMHINERYIDTAINLQNTAQ